MSAPSLSGFLWFVQNIMKISPSVLAPTDPVISFSYNLSLSMVNKALMKVPPSIYSDQNGLSLYTVAVYNLGGNNIVNFAQDAVDAPIYRDGMSYWEYTRSKMGINNQVMGVIQSASDEGTSQSMQLPEWTKGMTMADVQASKTPWGRMYLGLAQQYGPTIWGISG